MSTNGPTRSQNTNRLIRAWLDVADGRQPADALEAVLDEREHGLAETRADFERRLDGQPAPFVASMRPFADHVLRAVDDYGDALAMARAWLRSGDDKTLEEGLKRLTRIGSAVLDALASYDLAVLAERGPTPHALLNGLVKTCASAQGGSTPLGPVLAQARALLAQAAADGANDAAVTRLRAGAHEYLAAVTVMEQGDLVRGAAMIEDTASRLEAGAALLRQGAQNPGPTLFPLANALVNSVDAMRDGRVPAGLVEEVLASLESAFGRMRPALARAIRSGGSGATFAEEADRARQAMTLHESAIAELRDFLDSRSVSSLDAGVEKLREAVLELQVARAAFEEMADREGKAVCAWCSHPNEPGRSSCSRCGRVLPRWMDDDAPVSTFSVGEAGDVSFQADTVATEHMQRLVEAAELAVAGDISATACLEVVSWLDGLAADGIARLDRLRANEERDRAREALGWMREGLAQMRRPLSAGDASLLEGGLRTAQEGARMLHDAQQQANARLEEH